MGWLSMTSAGMGGHANPKAYLDDQFTYSRTLDGGGTRGMRVIDSAFVGNRVWYAAAEVSADPWEQAIARARAEVRDLIASGDLSHDEITASWIETWAADLYAEEREAA